MKGKSCPDGPADSWSSDFLVHAVISEACPARSDEFRAEYLRRLGIVDKTPQEREKLFRAGIVVFVQGMSETRYGAACVAVFFYDLRRSIA
jgi:hypothetical protein